MGDKVAGDDVVTGTPAGASAPSGAETTVSIADADPIAARLVALGVSPEVIGKIKSDLGATTVEDLAELTEADLIGAGMKALPARKVAKALAPATVPPPVATIGVPRGGATVSTVRLVEPPASVTSWLSGLCAIKPQIIQPLTVITGIKAAMADAYGYFQLPQKMMMMLRKAADEIGEGVPDLFFELQALRQARRYGALVAWMNGKGSACTIAERNRFLTRMNDRFWDSLDAFYVELETWRKGRRDSMDVGEQLAAAMSGEIQIYDATQVRTAAMALGDSINRTFSGTGVYAATALALDNDKLQDVIGHLDFRQFGVASREKLLAELACAAPPEMVSAEATIGKFAWNAMELRNMASGGNDEQRFLIELAAIGTGRQWNAVKALAIRRGTAQLTDEDVDDEDDVDGGRKLSGIGGRKGGRSL